MTFRNAMKDVGLRLFSSLRISKSEIADNDTTSSSSSATACDCHDCESSSNTTTSQIAVVDRLSDLEMIHHQDNVQMVVWRQQPQALQELISLSKEDLPTFVGLVTPDDAKEQLLEAWSSSFSAREELADEIEQLVDVFCRLSQSKNVHVKLRVIDGDQCKYWHRDSVQFRLVKTYRGPCTEYVRPEHSRKALKKRQDDCEHALSLQHTDVALFRGCGEQHRENRGIVHRSPRIPAGSGLFRLVLILDIPQEGWHY